MKDIVPQIDRDRDPQELPLEMARGIVTLRGQESVAMASADREFLIEIKECYCAYGACDFVIYPFTCECVRDFSPTARDVLSSLRPRWFKSEHIDDLDLRDLPFLGYQPLTDNDEIHTDSLGQSIFSKEPEDCYTKELHRFLKGRVRSERLFYVLLHDRPVGEEGCAFSEWVRLFAVGVSKLSDHLVGVVTHQACHNFCD